MFRLPVYPASVWLTKFSQKGVNNPLFFPVFCRKDSFLRFKFGKFSTNVYINQEIPCIDNITENLNNTLLVSDENTRLIADNICKNRSIAHCVIKSGEENKTWQSVETILNAAKANGLDRNGLFIAVGGGVIGDLCGFASSIYMRGCRFIYISTTLLGMVDASVGGKTGFDLFNIKNLVGSFYPAESVYIAIETLNTLPEKEWKSGFAELIKTAVLKGDDFLNEIQPLSENRFNGNLLLNSIKRAISYKADIVTKDPFESGKRMILNLGHTFGHALESEAGLGKITHGEAVAWGMVRSLELGLSLGITPKKRAQKIKDTITAFGYNHECPHRMAAEPDNLINKMKSDKKKKDGILTFIVPDKKSAQIVKLKSESELKILHNILKGYNNL